MVDRIYEGSSKNVYRFNEADKTEHRITTNDDVGKFLCLPAVSVFDWGRLKQKIPYKGAAIAAMSAHTAEALRDNGVPTTYIGIIKNGRVVSLSEVNDPFDELAIRLVGVTRPKFEKGTYDYSAFYAMAADPDTRLSFLIPLELIYRFGLVEGSSMLDDMRGAVARGNQAKIDALLVQTGLSSQNDFIPGVKFPKTVYNSTTKLEEFDRKLTEQEAFAISGLLPIEYATLFDMLSSASSIIRDTFIASEFDPVDGKLEAVFIPRYGLFGGDVAGNCDENRIFYKKRESDKEVIRQYKKLRSPTWVTDIKRAKATGNPEWRKLVTVPEPSMPEEFIELLTLMYVLSAEQYIGRKIFPRTISGMSRYETLENVLEEIHEKHLKN